MCVMIFDDDAAIGRTLIRAANAAGLDARAVTEPGAFERELRGEDPPTAVLLDLQLGDTDGIEQLRVLAATKYAGSLILMSGFDARVLGTAQSLGKSLGLKVDGILEKPLRLTELGKLFERLRSEADQPTIAQVRDAIAKGEMSLDFQPVVVRGSTELKKLEALIRWNHPVKGRLSPAAFLPVAESDTATIDALTDWVLSEASRSYHVLSELGLSVPVAVNISTRNLHDLTLPNRIEQHLRDGGLPPRDVSLEITETSAFKDAAATMDVLSRIRLKGMQLSIDDFGTGFSSMKLLRQMPFTEIKIDGSFVGDMASSRDSRAIVKSIVDLAANMGMSCVAEGVETRDTADLLVQMGVRTMQGYLFAHPMPLGALPSWIAGWSERKTAAVPPTVKPVTSQTHVEAQ